MMKPRIVGIICVAVAACATGPSEGDLGFQALSAGHYVEAETHLTKAIAETPDDPYVQLNLGATYQNLGKTDLARKYLTEVLTTGAGVVPEQLTRGGMKGQSLADVARVNLASLPR